MLRHIRETLVISFGTLLVACGVYFFKFPNNFSTGGVSGISIILGYLVPGVSSATFVLVINVLLLLLGFVLINGAFGLKTVYSSLLFSGVLWILERVCPLSAPMTTQPMLELVFSVLLPAFGSAILFNHNASTGGTDITAMILRKYSHMDIGKALLCVDVGITVAALFVFGIETGLFSVLGLVTKAFVVDNVIESFNTCKYFHIVTQKPQEVVDYIAATLHRGATLVEGTGAFTHQEKTVVMTVMTRPQAARLNQFLKKTDPGAFVTIMNTSTIIGKGFRAPA